MFIGMRLSVLFPHRLLWQWDGTKENAPQDQGDSLVRVARVFRVL